MADHVITFEREDDETLEIFLDGESVGHANHDQHGWAGMGALESMANNVARVLKAKIIET